MKSIEELRAKTIPLPCAFAGEAGTGEVADFPTPGTDTDASTSYQSGFPVKFATDPGTASGGHILRNDMNKIGEIATAELHFKEAGMKHEFRTGLLNSIVGYPLLCLFGHFDGEYLKHIESQSRDNVVNFTENPLCIDNYVAETTGGEKKVFWKTVDKIYGLDEDLFRLEVDYSRVDKLHQTDTLKEDSLIAIGDYGYPGEDATITPTSAKLTLTVGDQTIEFENKGKCGIKVVEEPINDPTQEVVITGDVPYPKEMCGYGNSTVVFYAKKGTAVSYVFNDGQTDSAGTNVFAFPVILKVGKASGGAE